MNKIHIVACAAAVIILCGQAVEGSRAEKAPGTEGPQWIAAMYLRQKAIVALRWSPVKEARGYRILRRADSEHNFTEIAASVTTQFIDRQVMAGGKGGTYHYRIQAIMAGEVVGESAEKKVYVYPEEGFKELTPPRWRNIEARLRQGWDKNKCIVVLEWQDPPVEESDRLVAFNVYRREGTQGEYTLMTSTRETVAVDDRIPKATRRTQSYMLTALDFDFTETQRSEERTATCDFFDIYRKISQKALDTVNGAINSADPFLQKAGFMALDPKRKDLLKVEELQAALGDEDPDVRWAALIALGRMDDARAAEGLYAAIETGDEAIREAAVAFLAERDHPGIVDLLTAGSKEDDEDLLNIARWYYSLRSPGGERRGALMNATLRDDTKNRQDREKAARMIACTSKADNHGSTANNLIRLLLGENEDDDTRGIVAAAFAYCRSYRPLYALLEDEKASYRVRSVAINELSVVKYSPDLVSRMIALLEDPDRRIRSDALATLRIWSGKDFGWKREEWHEWWWEQGVIPDGGNLER